jgi:dTDP-glucose 4,6-dehydratase
VRRLLRESDDHVVNLDCFTYAASPGALEDAAASSNYTLEVVDVADIVAVRRVFERHRPAVVYHLAAESHVDRSLDDPAVFVRSNVRGTFSLLQEARRHSEALDDSEREGFRFVHVSTDEVYGDLGDDGGAFTRESPYAPSSPYAASKAAADHLARAWYRSYGLPVIVTNCSNNYGPYQFPEKFIPHMIISALEGDTLPVYGDGRQVRDWIHVEDHVAALERVAERGRPGQTYLIGGNSPLPNRHVVERICALLDEARPLPGGESYTRRIRSVADRPGHDRRYAIDPAATEAELDWRPRESFESGLRRTIDWYLDNEAWWHELRSAGYERRRLGLGGATMGDTDLETK